MEESLLQPPKSHYTKAIIAGCISSSFCIIQVILNLITKLFTLPISAGVLNKVFGPWRPYSRSITMSWIVMTWLSLLQEDRLKVNDDDEKKSNDETMETKKKKNKQLRKAKFLSTLLCLILMFMPEGLKFLGGPALAPAIDNLNIIQLDLTVDNMDCGGCVIEVEGLISSQSGVVSAKVTDFELGEVEILVNTAWIDYDRGDFFGSMDKVLVSHGFALHERGWKTQKMKFDESFA